MTRYNHGDTIPFKVRAEDAAGAGITDANMVIKHWRASDDMFWNGSIWQANSFNIPMIEHSDVVNFPGRWDYNFPTGNALHNFVDNYYSEIVDLSGNAINGPFEIIESPVGGYLDRLAGLNHDNFVHDPTSYDISGRMVDGETRLYDSKANALLDDGATGLLYKYTVKSERTVLGFLAKFTQTREI